MSLSKPWSHLGLYKEIKRERDGLNPLKMCTLLSDLPANQLKKWCAGVLKRTGSVLKETGHTKL